MLQERVLRWINPSTTSLVFGTLADLTRGNAELLAENALLRQQLIILCRQIKRPGIRKTDRFLLMILARIVRRWKQAIFLVQSETLLRWHCKLFRWFWKRKSQARSSKQIHPKRARSQSWKRFLHNHGAKVWVCDFLQMTDLFFSPLFAFFIIELKSRKVNHVNVTCSPTDQWIARTAAGSDSVRASSELSHSG
jgi:putative transposase